MNVRICADEEFAKWAFGEVWDLFMKDELGPLDLLYAWNERHANLLLLTKEGNVYNDLFKMKLLWITDGMEEV